MRSTAYIAHAKYKYTFVTKLLQCGFPFTKEDLYVIVPNIIVERIVNVKNSL